MQSGYGLNYLIDIENAAIVDVEATPARNYDEVAATKNMIERTDQRFGLKPKRLAADTAYGTGKFLGWLLGAGITPHIPVWDKSARGDGTLPRADFRWDRRRGVYICSNNKVPHTSGTVHDGKTLLYRASKLDCDLCPIKARCCPGQLARKISRDVHEDARDRARRLMRSKAFRKSRDERKRVEMRFDHLKIYHSFELTLLVDTIVTRAAYVSLCIFRSGWKQAALLVLRLLDLCRVVLAMNCLEIDQWFGNLNIHLIERIHKNAGNREIAKPLMV